MNRNLSDEILLNIFDSLISKDLLACRYVCRSWCRPAQLKLLKEVTLSSNRAIDRFVAFFDQDRSQAHFNAVKKLSIFLQLDQPKPLDRETAEKLLLRFPNLENVDFSSSKMVKNFDMELCRKILSCCPKLDKFDVMSDYNITEYLNNCEKIRPLLSMIQLIQEFPFEDIDPEDYVAQFPRMQYILCEGDEIDSFETLLSVLEELSRVNRLYMAICEDLEEDYGKDYMSSQENNVMKKRLSNINNLSLIAYCGMTNTLKFVSKYFTGLKFFKVKCDFEKWEIADQKVLCRNTCKVIPSIKSYCNAKFKFMNFTALTSIFPTLVKTMFQKVPPIHKQSNSRVLELRVCNYKFARVQNPKVGLGLKSSHSPFSRKIRVTIDDNCNLNNIASKLFEKGAPMDEVDVFMLTMSQFLDDPDVVNMSSYINLLAKMPSVKQVEFDVPPFFIEEQQANFSNLVRTQVQEATFRSIHCDNMQPFLDQYCSVFPNLERLNIKKFCGEKRDHVGEYLLDLQNYSLDRLTIDVKKLVKEKKDFFVLAVEIQDSGERRLYKVPSDLSSSKEIEYSDLKGFKRPQDYLWLRVVVKCLKQVELYVLIDERHEDRKREEDMVRISRFFLYE